MQIVGQPAWSALLQTAALPDPDRNHQMPPDVAHLGQTSEGFTVAAALADASSRSSNGYVALTARLRFSAVPGNTSELME